MNVDELLDYLKSGTFDELKSIDSIEYINNVINANSKLADELEMAKNENEELRERNMKLFLMIQDDNENDEPDVETETDTVESFIEEMLKG